MDEVLKLTSLPMVPVIDNLFYLIFFFITNQFWRWVLELGLMFFGFFVRLQK